MSFITLNILFECIQVFQSPPQLDQEEQRTHRQARRASWTQGSSTSRHSLEESKQVSDGSELSQDSSVLCRTLLLTVSPLAPEDP